MPELPEVETICRELSSHILNKIISNAERLTNFNLRQAIPSNIEDIIDAKITNITRRAKYIQIFLSNDLVLVIHLGMSGKILLKEQDYIAQKHDHFLISLNNKQTLIYHDPRRFGLIDIIKRTDLENHPLFKSLGIEPFSDEFTYLYLAKLLHSKKQPIKLTLMDNCNVVGVGNIYAAESLFLSRILPTRTSSSLNEAEIKLLHKNIIHVLDESIKKGGSTLKDYAKISGEKGYFQNSFNVYGKDKQPCLTCNSVILKIVQAGRSSFYCSNCQK
jgi:formamidopyrimidine-DNA glycosylase